MAAQLTAAELFLAPVLRRDVLVKARGQSIVERISSGEPSLVKPGESARVCVVRRALTLLLGLHHALALNLDTEAVQGFLYTSTSRRTIDSLLDLISLEGIYPYLTPGVGVPIERRIKSVLQGRTVTQHNYDHGDGMNEDGTLLLEIVASLSEIGLSSDKGLCAVFQERTLVDLIAAEGQIAFALDADPSSLKYAADFKLLLEKTPLSVLFPTLTSLIHPATPDWLKSHLSTSLSLLPLRSGGVRDTIIFVASATSQNTGQGHNPSDSVLSPDVLNYASKLLSSVPSSLSATKYFAALAPQLYALLDDEGSDLQRVAAYIIGSGILGRRLYGSPGSAGWIAFADPLIKVLMPGLLPHVFQNTPEVDLTAEEIVTSNDLSRAVSRLYALCMIHPNPGLVKRLVGPRFLSIWAISHQSERSAKNSVIHDRALRIISTYLNFSAGKSEVIKLIDNLLWDGTSEWTFVKDTSGRLAICRRLSQHREVDPTAIVAQVDRGVRVFIRVQELETSESDFMDIFMHVIRVWLIGLEDDSEYRMLNMEPASWIDTQRKLLYAKLTQGLLERFKDRILANPDQMFNIVEQILTTYTEKLRGNKNSKNEAQQLSIMALGSIVRPVENGRSIGRDESGLQEIISMALGLLGVLLPTRSDYLTPIARTALESLQNILAMLIGSQNIPQSLAISASTAKGQISELLSDTNSRPDSSQTPSPYATALATRSIAMKNLSSPMPPIRAEGLSSLTSLINSSSPVIDVPSTTILLLSLLQDDEEFIYLAAIKSLDILAQRHPRIVTGMILDRYIDQEEESALDVRLRMGEALRSIITVLGPSLKDETAVLLAEGLVSVAGRRGYKPKAADERRKGKLVYESEGPKAEATLSREVRKLEAGHDVSDEAAAELAQILLGWEGQEKGEDVRMRTSALSVLGVALENSVASLGFALVSSMLDLAIAILRLETTAEKDIVRRAAALFLMSFVRGLDNADERGDKLGADFVGGGLKEVLAVVGYLRSLERDVIVAGHLWEVIQGLGNWVEKQLSRASEQNGGVQFGLEGELRGLHVNVDSSKRARPRIEEIG